jgi:hypothetical protein
VTGRATGEALVLIFPCLEVMSHYRYTTITELYEHLDELYSDLNREHDAHQAFKDLVIKKTDLLEILRLIPILCRRWQY